MKKIKIIKIKNIIAKGHIPPKRIRYNLLEDNYNILVYDEEELEYRFENDHKEFWDVPNHHLNDYVEILEDKEIEERKRLNNFINELEKFIEIWRQDYLTVSQECLLNAFEKKIKELKGSDKE